MRTTSLVILLLACPALSIAQLKPVSSYKDLKYPALHQIKVPQPEKFTMPNGITVFLLEDHELPVISMQALIRTGGRYVPAEKSGLAAVVGTVMRTGGTPSRSGNELDELLDRIGASVETGIGPDSGRAFVSVLKGDVDTALPILSDILRHPAFPDDKIELAKIALRDGISRRNDDPGSIANREFGRILYGKDSPYTRQIEYDTVDAITKDDLVAFHKHYFQPENVIIGAWGDFKAADMRNKIETEFGSWAKGNQPMPTVPKVDVSPSSLAGTYLVDKSDVNQSTILVGALGGKRNDPDYYANLLLSEILGGGQFGSRLLDSVRSKNGLAYSVYSAWAAQYDHPGVIRAGAGTDNHTTFKALALMKEEMRRIGEAEVSNKEFRDAKDSILKGEAFDFDSTNKIVDRLMTYQYFGYPSDYLQRFHDNIEKVTKADILRVAKQYWNPDRMSVLILGKPADFDSAPASMGQLTNIDIAIPKPAKLKTAAPTTQTLASGTVMLAKVQQAMGGNKLKDIQNYVGKTSMTVATPNGDMSFKNEETITAQGKFLQTMVTPMGEMKVIFNGDKAYMVRGGGEMQEAPQAVGAMKELMFRQTLHLLTAPNLAVQALGPTQINNTPAEGIQVSDPESKMEVKLLVDPKTYLITGKSYTSTMPGQSGEIEEIYLEYKDVAGVKFPTRMIVNRNGKKALEATVTDLSVNADIPASAFSKP